MGEKKRHPTFTNAKPEHQWTRSLAALIVDLRRLALARADALADHPERDEMHAEERDWSWFVLPAGAVVSFRLTPGEYRRGELRLARVDPLEGDEQAQRWEREVQTFLQYFAIREADGRTPARASGELWAREAPHPADKGRTAVRFIELRHSEIAVGAARCHRCHEAGFFTECDLDPAVGFKGQRCERCKAGEDPGPQEGLAL